MERAVKKTMDEYPYCELEVFVAGYERGRRYVASRVAGASLEEMRSEELATRRLSMYDVTREGLLMLGMEAEFVPRVVFEAGVRRALSETTSSAS